MIDTNNDGAVTRKWPHHYYSNSGNASAGVDGFGGEFSTSHGGGELTTAVGTLGDTVSVNVAFEQGDARIGALAKYSPEEAREIANSILKAVELLEGEE